MVFTAPFDGIIESIVRSPNDAEKWDVVLSDGTLTTSFLNLDVVNVHLRQTVTAGERIGENNEAAPGPGTNGVVIAPEAGNIIGIEFVGGGYIVRMRGVSGRIYIFPNLYVVYVNSCQVVNPGDPIGVVRVHDYIWNQSDVLQDASFRIQHNGTIGNALSIGDFPAVYALDVFNNTGGVSGRFAGRVIGSDAIAMNEFVTLSQLLSLPGGGGTVTSVAATQPAEGLVISGSPITTAGTFVFSLANDLAAVEALTGTGIVRRSGVDTWTAGGVVTIAEGGTGLTALGTSLQLIRVNIGGTALEYFTPSYITGVTLTGDVAGTGTSSIATTIQNNVVSNAKFRQSAALSVVGNATNATANVADIVATANSQVLIRRSSTLVWDLLTAADLPDIGSGYIKNQTALQPTSNFNISGTGQATTFETSTGVFRSKRGTGSAGVPHYYLSTTAGNGRFALILRTTESGSNTGSNFAITRYDDAGTLVGDALAITRSTGDVTIASNLTVNTIANATTDTDKFLVSDGGVIKYRTGAELLTDIGGSGVTSVAATQPAAGFTISGSPITTTGTFVFTLANDLAALEGLSGTGIARRTGSDTWSVGTTVSIAEGGTGLTALGTALQLIRVNAGATALEYFTSTFLTDNQTITLSSDVTGSGTTAIATTIANDVVTNAKLSNMATATFKARITAGTGDPEDITGTQATTLLDVFTDSLKGLVPASGGGTANFLRADGIWAAPGIGVTSVGATQPAAGFTISGSPITTTGTFVFTLANDLAALEGLAGTGIARRTGTDTWTVGTTVSIAEGGTGLTALGTALQLLRVNAGATALEYFTPSAGGTIDGSGAANRVAYWSDADTLTSDAGFTFDGTTLTVPAGSTSGYGIAFASNSVGFYSPAASQVSVVVGSTERFRFTASIFRNVSGGLQLNGSTNAVAFGSTGIVTWGSSSSGGTANVGLARSASGILKVTDGTTGFGHFTAANATFDSLKTSGSAPATSGTTKNVITDANGLLSFEDKPIAIHGTYTPTLTNVTNITASTAYVCQYLRVGNVVTFSGKVLIEATIETFSTSLALSLPIASSFAANQQLAGTMSISINSGVGVVSGTVEADTVNDRALINFNTPVDHLDMEIFFHATYLIV